MVNIVLAAIIVITIGGASYYLYRAKKNGQACIGCPSSKECGRRKCGCGCSDCGDK